MEEKVYQGYIYRRSGPNEPWTQVGPAQQSQPRMGGIISDPYRARSEARQDEDQGIQRRNADITAETAERGRASDAIDNPQKLRKEYNALPEVKEYRIAAQMASGALKTDATPQGDLALVYAFAKAMDPGSVVRDQEANMVTNSQPWFQSAVANAKKQFGMDGAGSFDPKTRARLRVEIIRALTSRQPLYEARRKEFGTIADANGIDPKQVIFESDTDAFAKQFREYAQTSGDEGGVIATLLGEKIDPAPQAAGYGATESSVNIPPEMQSEHAAYLAKNWGKLDPQDYAAFRINLDKKYGFGSDVAAYTADAPKFNEFAAKGGLAPQISQIPDVKKDLSGIDQFRNNALSNPLGAGAASALNAGGFGLPSLLAPEESQALREAYPKSSFAGELVGGLGGVGLAGRGLRAVAREGEGAVAQALASPLAADVGYGSIYGATQADDPLYGAVGGGLAGALGNRIGGAIARETMPNFTSGGAVRAADNAVPTPQELRDLAGQAYSRAEATGQRATGNETLALADTTNAILSREGRLTPQGNLTEVQPKVREAFRLINEYGGEEMLPTQLQATRSVVSDGLSSQEASERRIARLLLNNFDEWSDTVTPELSAGLREGREISSRYIQGDKLANLRELAEPGAGQYTQSGMGNALRTQYRGMDRSITKGRENFPPEVVEAVQNVARGTPTRNALRYVGKLAPTGQLGMWGTLGASGAGGAVAGPLGAAGPIALALLGTGARKLEANIADRAATVAENTAYGGAEYADALAAALATAQERGGHVGAVGVTDLARLLAEQAGY